MTMNITQAINGLGTDYVNKVTDAMKQSATINSGKSSNGTFDDIFNAAAGLVESTNTYIQQAQQAQVDWAIGKLTNPHELGAYQQQANIALQFTVAVRDKAIEAYKELMNMQI